MKSENINNLLLPILEKNKANIAFAYLFGSSSKDTVYPLSDIDIALYITGINKESLHDIKLSLHADFCRALKRNDIDVVILNIANNIILLDEIIRHGMILYDRDSNLREEFEQKFLHRAIDFKNQRLAAIGI